MSEASWRVSRSILALFLLAPFGSAGGASTYYVYDATGNLIATLDGTSVSLCERATNATTATTANALSANGTICDPGQAARGVDATGNAVGCWVPGGAGSVGSAAIIDGSIVAADLADGAVTTTKLANGSVTGAKIAAGTITDPTLAASTLTNRVQNFGTPRVATDVAIKSYVDGITGNKTHGELSSPVTVSTNLITVFTIPLTMVANRVQVVTVNLAIKANGYNPTLLASFSAANATGYCQSSHYGTATIASGPEGNSTNTTYYGPSGVTSPIGSGIDLLGVSYPYGNAADAMLDFAPVTLVCAVKATNSTATNLVIQARTVNSSYPSTVYESSYWDKVSRP